MEKKTTSFRRYLSLLSLLGLLGFWDLRFAQFGAFAMFVFSDSESRTLRMASHVGWLGFLAPLFLLLDWWVGR